MANSTFFSTFMSGKVNEDGSIEGTFGGNLYFKKVDQGQPQPMPAKVIEQETKNGGKYRAVRLTLQIAPDNSRLNSGRPAHPVISGGKVLTLREYLEEKGIEVVKDKVFAIVTLQGTTPGLYQLLSKSDLSYKTPVLISGTLSIYDRKDKNGNASKGLAINRVSLCCIDHIWEDKPEDADKWKHLEQLPAQTAAPQQAAPQTTQPASEEEIGFTFIPEDEIPF